LIGRESFLRTLELKIIFYHGLDVNEYNHICNCDATKQVWDKLVATYEGTIQVQETKMNM